MPTGHAEPGSRRGRNDEARRAQHHAGQAVLALVRSSGSPLLTRPPDTGGSPAPAASITGVRAVRAIEQVAHCWCRRYARVAREDGHTWHEIGAALGLAAGGEDAYGETVAAAAFCYITGPGSQTPACGPSVTWCCPACSGMITDQGPQAGGPQDSEHGHGPGCRRLADAITVWAAAGSGLGTAVAR